MALLHQRFKRARSASAQLVQSAAEEISLLPEPTHGSALIGQKLSAAGIERQKVKTEKGRYMIMVL
jgi:hypothetical protein